MSARLAGYYRGVGPYRRRGGIAMAGVAALMVAGLAYGQTSGDVLGEDAVRGGRQMMVEVVGGVPLVKGWVESPRGRVAGHFVLDLGRSHGLMVPENQATNLGLKVGEQGVIVLDDVRVEGVAVSEGSRAEKVREISALHASELREVPILGTLGLGTFGGNAVELDIEGNSGGAGGMLRVFDIKTPVRPNGVTAVGISQEPPVLLLGKEHVSLDLMSSVSRVSVGAVDRLGITGSAPIKVLLGETDLLGSAAFLPAKIESDLALGSGWFSQYRVTFVPARQEVWFEKLRASQVLDGEQAYYIARYRGDGDAIASFIRRHPDHPMANEAAIELLELRLNKEASDKDLTEAVHLVGESFPVPRRAARLIALADDILSQPVSGAAKYAPVVEKLLTEAALTSEQDLDGRATFAIHARRGLIAMRGGDLVKARRLLISAAYGLKGDTRVDTWLGQVYRASRELDRAWLRFVDAAMAQNAAADSMRELDGLLRVPGFARAVPLGQMELMLEGRVPSFVPTRDKSVSEVPQLILGELFVDDSNAGSVGQQLAFDGLRHYFAGMPATFIAYHFGPAGNTAVSLARAKYYGLRTLPSVKFDGRTISSVPVAKDGSGTVFEDHLAVAFSPSPAATRPSTTEPVLSVPTLKVSSTLTGNRLDVQTEITPEGDTRVGRDLDVFVYLCQRRVFAIGGNGAVMHYAVVREELSAPVMGLGIASGSGRRVELRNKADKWTYSADLSQLSAQIESAGDSARARQRVKLPAMMTAPLPTSLDGEADGSFDVVVLIHDAQSRQLLSVGTVRPVVAGEAKR